MRKTFGIFITGVLVTAVAAYAGAQGGPVSEPGTEVSWVRSWMSEQEATGGWDGTRDDLKERGVEISSNFTTDIGGNPSGGVKQSAKYSGFLDLGLSLDFDKLASLKGLALAVSTYYVTGRNLSAAIGNLFGVQEIYAPGSFFLGQLALSQSVFSDTVIMEVGRIFAGDVFATSDLWQYYVSGGINSNFQCLETNIFFPHYNIATWGVRASYEPTKEWNLVGAMYNADPTVQNIDKYGSYWNFRTQFGYLAMVQLTHKYHHDDRDGTGLPGSISIGGYYESSKFPELINTNKERRGNYGTYLIFDQMIYRGDWPVFEGPSHMRAEAGYSEKVKQPYHPETAFAIDRPVGLTVWGGAYLAPQAYINPQTYQLTTGLTYQGMFPGRERDMAAFAVIIGKFSDKLPEQSQETVLELNYRFQAGPWFHITPDIQYVINPNGDNTIRDALVLGMEISATF